MAEKRFPAQDFLTTVASMLSVWAATWAHNIVTKREMFVVLNSAKQLSQKLVSRLEYRVKYTEAIWLRIVMFWVLILTIGNFIAYFCMEVEKNKFATRVGFQICGAGSALFILSIAGLSFYWSNEYLSVIENGIESLSYLKEKGSVGNCFSYSDVERLELKKKSFALPRRVITSLLPCTMLVASYFLLSSASDIDVFVGYSLITLMYCTILSVSHVASIASNKAFWQKVIEAEKRRNAPQDESASSSSSTSEAVDQLVNM